MIRLRAPIRYYGGKGNLMNRLLPFVPPGGRPYCEPFCGAASLLFARDPAPVEVLNDLDGDIVNLFRVLQDREGFEALRHRLLYTPYARAEFVRALRIRAGEEPTDDPVLRAWATFVTQNQSVGGKSRAPGDWGRAFTTAGGMAGVTNKWLMRLSMLADWHRRLLRVQIDQRDALEVIRYWDNDEAVFYVDPPYVAETRQERNSYRHEYDDAQHAALVATLLACRGAVVLSGYASPLYAPLERAGWERIDVPTVCHAAAKTRGSGRQGTGAALAKVPRTESIWRNPQACVRSRRPLFASAAAASHEREEEGEDEQ